MRDHNNMREWLIPFLEDMGIGIEKFSYEADMTKNTVYNYLNGVSNPKPETIARMYNAVVKLGGPGQTESEPSPTLDSNHT